jgi:hypothetical protein
MSNAQRRHWCHTVWPKHIGLEATDDEAEIMHAFEHFWTDVVYEAKQMPGLRYAIGQIERSPETGTLHIQAYTEWKSSKRRSEVYKIFPSSLQFRKGTRDDARDYCRKKIWKGKEKGQVQRLPEFGKWRVAKQSGPSPKQRALDYLTKGFTPSDILHRDPEVYFTHHRSIEATYNLICKSGISLNAIGEEE